MDLVIIRDSYWKRKHEVIHTTLEGILNENRL